MSAVPTPGPARPKARPSLYAAVWRWHFYAGLFCVPFIIILALTGSVYLVKPQIEAWQDRPYDGLVTGGVHASPERQVAAALGAVPGASFQSLEVRRSLDDAARVTVSKDGEDIRVLVHPRSAEVLAIQPERERFMQIVRDIHGELLMGERGSLLVELAASWAIVMILTGLYLWWPRQARGLAGVLYPRLTAGGRVWWRDLHAVTGVWISALALALLITGLPWTSVWGGEFKTVRQITGTAAEQDWPTGGARANGHGEHGEHNMHGRGHVPSIGAASLTSMTTTLRSLDLPPPVLLSTPRRGESDWRARSDTPNRPLRVTLKLNPRTGAIIRRQSFSERHPIDRAVGYGIAAHEGQLFGVANQFLGILTAAGLVTLAVTGTIMWWRRRPEGRLVAPGKMMEARIGRGVFAVIAVAGLLLPLFGLSLLVVAALENLTLGLFAGARAWLGLRLDPRRGSPS